MTRIFDVLLSAVAICILLPFMFVIMVILRLTGDHQVFYLQPRVGRKGRDFNVIKFVTMVKDSEHQAGGYLTQKNDPRILPFGKFLRKTKINEFPQLINIFVGQMSVVGPRPQARPHYELYSEEVKHEIDKVRPGLTGIGSVIFRDEETILDAVPGDRTAFHDRYLAPYKGELELWYTKHRTLHTYFLLIALTVWVVFRPQSDLYRYYFRDLPNPPPELAPFLWSATASSRL